MVFRWDYCKVHWRAVSIVLKAGEEVYMGRFSGNYIDSYEKKLSVQQIYQMYQEKKIVLPKAPPMKRAMKIERISQIVEIILLGLALPAVYVSEKQNGSLLVLEADDRLRCLIEFLEGYYPVRGLEFYPELDECRVEQLEQKFPRMGLRLYDYRFSFQIIEYTTPRYMHMQMGNYIERWNFTREQGIRNELYGKDLERRLVCLEQTLEEFPVFFSKVSLNRQYMVLRILMCHFVRMGEIQDEWGEILNFQQLLDRTAVLVPQKNSQWMSEMADAFRAATEELVNWDLRVHYGLEREKGKERQARVLSYLYNVVWTCREKGCEGQWGLEKIAWDNCLWKQIGNEKVNIANIRTHFDIIEERLL